MSYNPYDLIPLLVNGQDLHGRPIEFDSDVANQQTMENSFGNPVKPTKISTCCPDCGQGLEFELTLGDPPFSAVEVICYHCNPEAPAPADPFMNPLEDGRVPDHDLDPLLHNPNEQVVTDEGDDTTLADRLEFPSDEESLVDAVEVSNEEETTETPEETPETPEETPEEAKAETPEDTPEEVPEAPEIPVDPKLSGFGSTGGTSVVQPTPEAELPTETSGAPAEVVKDPVEEATEELVVTPDEETTVEAPDPPEAEEEVKEEAPKPKKKRAPRKKKAKKPKVEVEPADGLTPEVDIEEDDLAEQE